jgi:hypothetical protein
MKYVFCLIPLVFACSSSDPIVLGSDAGPLPDAGQHLPDSLTPDSTADSAPDAAPDGGPEPEAGTDAPAPEAGPPAVDAGPDSLPPGVDVLTDVPALADVVGADTASQDAAPDRAVDDVASDARDALTTADADAGFVPVCDVAVPSCASAMEADALIRATFPQPCTPEADRKCGGVFTGSVVTTFPMVCRSGQWRLAGGQSGSQWVPAYQCSVGCAQGKICGP